MGKVKIFADSTCDLSPELIKENDIVVIPVYVVFGEDVYKDGIDITLSELYTKVDQCGQLPKTSATGPKDYYQAFEPYINEGYDIVHVAFSSELSSMQQNARLAAQDFPEGRVFVVDSRNLSTGQGLLVLKAADMAREGLSAQEIAERVTALVPKVETEFVIDTLEYLHKGGRCSGMANLIGSMLKIHPLVKVVDGKMILAVKLRGKRDRILQTMLERALEHKGNIDPTRAFVTHCVDGENAVFLKEQLEKELNIKQIHITEAGTVVGSHCGPHTVGILFIRNK